MKYDVKFKCGHTETVKLFGKYKDRENKIKWYETNCSCSECSKKAYNDEMMKTHDVIEMHYGKYKNEYSDCKTVIDSYNSETKTIKVYVKKTEIVKEIEDTKNECIEILKTLMTEEDCKKQNKTYNDILNDYLKWEMYNRYMKTKKQEDMEKVKKLNELCIKYINL